MAFRITPGQVFALQATCWPDVKFYDKEVEIITAALTARETYVTAGNKLGKDFSMGFLAPACFVICQQYGVTCRILTTSVAEHHLKVLWGEIGRFVSSGRLPDGRSLVGRDADQMNVNYMELRRAPEAHAKNPLSYLVGRVSERGEGLQGHHAEFTLLVGDEASGLDRTVHQMALGWAQHVVYIGNPWECQNHYRDGVRAGDAPPERRVIRIRAEDSPNVIARSDDYFPNVLAYSDYLWQRKTYNPVDASVKLDGTFYEGPELVLYPAAWLNRAESLADALGRDGKGRLGYKGARGRITLGVDPGEGGAQSAFCVGDALGVIELTSIRTPDTTDVPNYTVRLIKKYDIDPEDVCIDTGGGGKQHADWLRSCDLNHGGGYQVRVVPFGGAVVPEPRHAAAMVSDRRGQREEAYEYRSRRAQMAGELRELLDPSGVRGPGYAIPTGLRGNDDDPSTALRPQMAPIPLKYDKEGRLVLPHKHKPNPDSREVTLTDLIGHSPDEYDALLLMTHALLHQSAKRVAGRLVQ